MALKKAFVNTEQKRILIVGGASGIGHESVELLLSNGLHPIIADNNEERLKECQNKWPGSCRFIHLDIANQSSVKDGLNRISEYVGTLDAVVITAAIHSCYPIEYLTDEVIDRVMNVNLVAQIKFIRDIIPLINEGGRIITISSVSAGVGIPMESMYCASKAGLEVFFEALSVELSYKGIKVVIVQPGNVNTGFNETGNDYRPSGNKFLDEMYTKVLDKTQSKYGIPPKKVAEIVYNAIFCNRPKLCYLAGINAMKAHWAKRLLGRDLAIKILAKMFMK